VDLEEPEPGGVSSEEDVFTERHRLGRELASPCLCVASPAGGKTECAPSDTDSGKRAKP